MGGRPRPRSLQAVLGQGHAQFLVPPAGLLGLASPGGHAGSAGGGGGQIRTGKRADWAGPEFPGLTAWRTVGPTWTLPRGQGALNTGSLVGAARPTREGRAPIPNAGPLIQRRASHGFRRRGQAPAAGGDAAVGVGTTRPLHSDPPPRTQRFAADRPQGSPPTGFRLWRTQRARLSLP